MTSTRSKNGVSPLRSSHIISSLHAILKPFLLRRVKADVMIDLPPKKEYVLYAPLTMRQREAYDQVVAGTLRAYLIGDHGGQEKTEAEKVKKAVLEEPRQLRKKGTKNYDVDVDDDTYFEMLENGEVDERGIKPKAGEDDLEKLAREHQYKSTRKSLLSHCSFSIRKGPD
jgi:ATP-dependent DNA helicase